MKRARPPITGVDRVLVRWLESKRPGRETKLIGDLADALGEHASGRLGWMLGSERVLDVLGDVECEIDHVKIDGDGRLCAMIMVEGDADGLHWEHGTLSLWRNRHPLPESIIMALPGMPLDAVVDHPLTRGSMRIAEVEATDFWTRLRLDDWTRPASDFGIA